MKHLILIRHANAQNPRSGQRDFDRELSSTGKKEAVETGKVLKLQTPLPEQIICSDAIRTTATARLVAKTIGLPENSIHGEHAIYGGSYTALLYTIASIPDTVQCIALVGHNPSISELTGILSVSGELIMMKTAAAIRIDLPADTWREAVQQRGTATPLCT